MSPSSPSDLPTIAPVRAITRHASFGACGALLLALFVIVVGCGSFAAAPPEEILTPNARNAILCACECDGPVGVAVPSENIVKTGADDATQAQGQADAVLTTPFVTLGQGGHVGVRFQKVGLPPKVMVTSAFIQFSATQQDLGAADLSITIVNAPNVGPFADDTDLRALTTIGSISWVPAAWNAANDRGDAQKTTDVSSLLQAVVNLDGYTPDSAVAFVITGSGRRLARALEGQAQGGRPAGLTVTYVPRKITQEFLACGNPADAANVCGGVVQSNVQSIAQQCKLANTCTCKEKTGPGVDPNSFSAVCNGTCPKVVAPDNCDPNLIAQTTAATNAHTPVCVANSPLGSVLFGQTSSCDVDPAQSSVTVRVFDDDDSLTRSSGARGRVEFFGTPCPGEACDVGLTHRIHAGDLTFDGGLFSSDHTIQELSGVGTNLPGQFANVNAAGTGFFNNGSMKHSIRGHEEDGDTVAVLKTGTLPVEIGVGGWQSNGVCSIKGMLFKGTNMEMSVDIKGRLVNQPPFADAGPDRSVECNQFNQATFALDGTAFDADNNIASMGWFSGGRKGTLVGALASIQVTQPLSDAPTPYVFKVMDTFGRYDESTASIKVIDTTKPVVTPPQDVEVECTSPNGTPANIGLATAVDICDAAPAVFSNAPQVFPLGITNVVWSGKDASTNVGTATQQVRVVDRTPPVLTLSVSPTSLWPPNHKMQTITATINVTDKCDPNPKVKLISITSNESPNGSGDGNTNVDIEGATIGSDDRTFSVRSERSGNGDGRVYTIVYEASDASGNTTRRQATVTVSHNK